MLEMSFMIASLVGWAVYIRMWFKGEQSWVKEAVLTGSYVLAFMYHYLMQSPWMYVDAVFVLLFGYVTAIKVLKKKPV